jgi:putative peptidoglycan lipid II flippase
MSHIARSSLIIAFFFGVDKVLAFVRQIFIARQFGLGTEIDAFNAANNIPDLLSALISGGALGLALLPVLSEYLTKSGRVETWELFSRILNLAFLVTAALSILIAIFARPFMVYVIAPGFVGSQQDLAVELMRLDLVAILIFSISGLVMAGLQANQHFLLPAMAPAFYNLGQIFGVVILAPQVGYVFGPLSLPGFGLGIHGLVYGVVLGALLHLGIQVPGLVRFGFRWIPAIDIHHPGMIKLLRLVGPRVLTMFFLQVFFIYRDHLASQLETGAVTALNYGWFFMQVPETLIGSAIAIALLPTLSEQMARADREAFLSTVNRAVRVLLSLTIPVAALLIVGIRPLVQTLLGFDSTGTEMVVWATRMYLLGLMGHSLLEVGARSFYAQQDARTPLFAAALNALFYIVLATYLVGQLGQAGIALANTLAFTSEALLLLFLLNRRFPGIWKAGSTLVRVCMGAAGSALLVYLLMRYLPLPLLPLTLGALALGMLAMLPMAWPELKSLVKL